MRTDLLLLLHALHGPVRLRVLRETQTINLTLATKDRFIGGVFRPFQFLARDLGLFNYDSKLITTTHVATFHFAMPPQVLLSKAGPEVQAFTEQYGRYFQHLGAQVPAAGSTTFFSRLDPAKLSDTIDDVRSAEYYDDVFDGSASPDLNALLTVFRCMANYSRSDS